MPKIRTEAIVIFILLIYAIESLISINYVSLEFKLGLAGLVIASALLIKSYKFAFYALLLFSFISFFDVIAFSQTSIFFGINGIKLNVISTILFLFLCIRRRRIISELFGPDAVVNPEEIRQRKIDFLKKEFANLPMQELSKKIESTYLTIEAKEAATELLKERKKQC